jgi:hypothetical protein
MTLPTIPGSSISLSQIQTEFGGSNPISISEYYAGGSYVGSGKANATSVAIPTSGTISFANFSGASAIQTYYSGTITQAFYSFSSSPTFSVTYQYGFIGPGQGSRSPTTLTTGATLGAWYDYFYYVGGSLVDSYCVLYIQGFGSDPGSGYITSAKVGTTTKTPTSYGYAGSGNAYWYFNTFGFGSTGTAAAYLYH